MIISLTAALLAASQIPMTAVAATTIATASQDALPPPRVGGFRPANTSDARVQAAATFAAAQIGVELSEVETAQQQVVQGINYRLVISTTEGARYRVDVHVPLRGEMVLRHQEQIEVG